MQFVCRIYNLQHDEGRYFLHEHRQSELPWRKDCVEEIQEMTGAKLMSVSQGSLQAAVNGKVRLLNKRYTEHLERKEHKSIEDLREDIYSGIQLQHKWSRQHKYLLANVDVKNPHANVIDLENSVPPEETSLEPSSTLQCITTYTWSCVRRRRRQSSTTTCCAKLRMSMYGTKASAQNWQKKVQEPMATLGFSIVKGAPVLFCHPQRSLKCLVHGDDFVVSGEPVDLVWMRSELESQLEINTTILADEPGMSKEVKILKRKLCWHDGVGISYDADRKHAEATIRETGASNLCPKRARRMCEIKKTRKVGKFGHEGTATDRTDFEPC